MIGLGTGAPIALGPPYHPHRNWRGAQIPILLAKSVIDLVAERQLVRRSIPVTRMRSGYVTCWGRHNLCDEDAATAIRDRICWKYALGLDLDDTGFDASVLTEFRTRLAEELPPAAILVASMPSPMDHPVIVAWRRAFDQHGSGHALEVTLRIINPDLHELIYRYT